MLLQDQYDEDKRICLYEGEDPERFLEAVIPPTFGNSLFLYPTLDELGQAVADERKSYVYWRGTNPTVEIAEKKLAALERGERCKCFASGAAAISAALHNSLQSGDHILCVSHVYQQTMDLITYLQKFGITHSVVPSVDIADIASAIQPGTKVIYVESPTDLQLRLVDLQGVADLAKSRGIRTIIDNTWATPLFQKPLLYGFDIVVHSASKYLGGHSDLVGGAVITSAAVMKELFEKEYLLYGGIMAPAVASLLLRGLRTLPLRMKAHEENALQVARFLSSHGAVAQVQYPGLPSHPDYELGLRQLHGYSGLLTFTLQEESYEAVQQVIDKLQVFRIGLSYGSFESLALSPNYGYNEEQLRQQGFSPGLIRLAVGLEPVQELIADLEQALQ
ncbi:trans-sulfuration enzyme family protein [Ectobacillus ponti]|uniref:homocysteine desulfhydrase n=1 Tax=Ectobacillus ponti TaxID=2961894 RepID=A0AA41X393_9BACI|nr:aminotransferase class I/II-fold pyridoxal phosphate-dependent enzyme [Ectobacillus ponti]MCP8968136.1 aminotransferase class I/II-fold pyridoxal phosphate-dependent enzyme [Ectobacillus ponti]